MDTPSLPLLRAGSVDGFIAGTLRDLPEQLERPPTIAETEQRVQQIRAYFSQALVKELRRMNQAASTICTLPSEVVSLFAAQLDFRDVLLAASICSRLRQVIVTTPSLWTDVPVIFRPDSTDGTQLDAFLTRSAKMSVSVSLKGSSDGPQLRELVELPLCIFEHLDHITHLSVDFKDFGFSVTAMTCPAPMLQSLTLRAPMVRYYLQRLPGNLCSGVLPNLTFVDLEGFALPKEPVEFPAVRQLQMHAIPSVDHWNADYLHMRRIAQSFPNLARLCLGKGPFPTHPVERLHHGKGLDEVLIGDESQFDFESCGLRLDLIPRLVALSETPGMALLCRSPSKIYFFKYAMEGVTDDGRVINVAWPSKQCFIRSSWCENIRSVFVHIEYLRFVRPLDWPVLESVEFDITHPSPIALKAAFAMSRLDNWNAPILRRVRIVFTEDSRGRGTRVVFPFELVRFLQRFKTDPPVIARLDLVNLRLWELSDNLSSLVTELLVSGQPYEELEKDARNCMCLIPITTEAAMDEVGEDDDDSEDEDYLDSGSSSTDTSSSQNDSSGEDYTGSSSPSDPSSDSAVSALSHGSSDVTTESARLKLKAVAVSEWKLLTSEFPARKIRDLLINAI